MVVGGGGGRDTEWLPDTHRPNIVSHTQQPVTTHVQVEWTLDSGHSSRNKGSTVGHPE